MSPEFFQSILDQFPDAALLVSATGTVRAANRAAGKLLGRSGADLRDRPLTDLVRTPPADLARYLRACARSRDALPGALSVAGGDGQAVEYRAEGAVVRPRDGDAEAIVLLRVVPKEVAVARFLALNQQVAELSREVARRRQAEADLRAERERLRVTLTSIGDGVIATDAAGTVTFLNPVAEALTGWSYADAAGRPLREVFNIANEFTHQRVENPVERVLAFGTRVGLANHTELVARDGTRRPIDDCAAPMRDDAGNLTGAVLVFRDVSERRRAEDALRVSRERLDLTVQSIDVGLWYCDLPLDRLDWNDRCKEHFGLPPDAEVTIDTFYDRLHSDDREPTRAAIERALADLSTFDRVYRTLGPDGGERWVRAIGRAFCDPTGRPVRFDGVTVDVTRQKRAEADLREAARHKDEYLAMLAHELRNPLAPIRNGVQILQSTRGLPPAADRVVAMMDRQTRHMTRVIDDLLDVSRMARGKLQLTLERVDLGDVVRTSVADYCEACENQGVPVEVHTPDTPVWVQGDATRLNQVVANLVQNACKFTDPGGRVAVRVTADADRRRAVLSIRDTGVGLDPDVLRRLFKPFSQADRTLDRARGGLGLGLALVKGLAELHDGGVHAHSDGPGCGAEFTVWLPLEDEPAALAGSPTAAGPASARRRVLIIEDNADAAESLEMLLEVLGHEVRVARTGPDGVREAVAWRPDVVLCDIGLPGLDGYAVVGELHRRSVGSTALLIALTGYGAPEDRARAVEAGFHHHLTKPADPSTLLALLSVPG